MVGPESLLIDALVPTGIQGLHGTSNLVEAVIGRIVAEIERAAADEPSEHLQFPPLLNRADFEKSDYFRNFGHLVGAISCFCGDEETHRAAVRRLDDGQDWTGALTPSDLVFSPTACYPVYPALARRPPVSPAGHVVDVVSWCFRRESAADEPTRMQCFRMYERVYAGTQAGASSFRERWTARSLRVAERLGLQAELALANDPFFGRTGVIMIEGQRAQALKLELLVPFGGRSVACGSFNLHLTKMSRAWDLRLAGGGLAATACVGFGLERLAFAVIAAHAPDPLGWLERHLGPAR